MTIEEMFEELKQYNQCDVNLHVTFNEGTSTGYARIQAKNGDGVTMTIDPDYSSRYENKTPNELFSSSFDKLTKTLSHGKLGDSFKMNVLPAPEEEGEAVDFTELTKF
jgi:hypothetical protein